VLFSKVQLRSLIVCCMWRIAIFLNVNKYLLYDFYIPVFVLKYNCCTFEQIKIHLISSTLYQQLTEVQKKVIIYGILYVVWLKFMCLMYICLEHNWHSLYHATVADFLSCNFPHVALARVISHFLRQKRKNCRA